MKDTNNDDNCIHLLQLPLYTTDPVVAATEGDLLSDGGGKRSPIQVSSVLEIAVFALCFHVVPSLNMFNCICACVFIYVYIYMKYMYIYIHKYQLNSPKLLCFNTIAS